VNAEPDLAAAANATGRIGDGAPALWFDNIRGFTDARVAMNTIGSWQNHAISLGLPPNTPVKNQIDEFIRRWDKFPVTPERRANPAWAENTVDGEAINLFDILPCSVSTTATAAFISTKPAWSLAIRSTRTILVSKTSAFTVWR
jgi:UbiD family decarboxylase